MRGSVLPFRVGGKWGDEVCLPLENCGETTSRQKKSPHAALSMGGTGTCFYLWNVFWMPLRISTTQLTKNRMSRQTKPGGCSIGAFFSFLANAT